MNVVNVTSINVLDNPCAFGNPFQFEITFECLQELKEDLDWKIIYVGSAESEKYDQELESVLVGPVPVGVNKFVFQAPAPDATKIPENDLLGVTVVLVTCSYNEKEFIRVGYYVNNSYSDPELVNNPPSPPRTDLMHREILAQKPRVTRFPINWDNPAPTANAASPGTESLTTTSSSSSSGMIANNKVDENDVLMDMEDDDEDLEEDDDEEEEDVNGEVDLMEEDM
jgi:histone chaperone ASF1